MDAPPSSCPLRAAHTPALLMAAMAIVDGKIRDVSSPRENIISEGITSSKLEMMETVEGRKSQFDGMQVDANTKLEAGY